MESAAAILVQTMFAGDERLQTLLRGQATQGPGAAADLLIPYYVAALIAIKKAHQTNPSIR